eukprot:CAMPEP_0114672096 /NCGR_PEP_ID=MMETSP0191-20121206/42286_1 /TAXON_ID=126664 /ORGANISM="Sorites sp." /LENGTH=691 /DNA_ID=CAMNT_0001933537 /DNA_START=213 /DNA_END=2288 /DNA_ORIENTATION=-
MKAKFQEMYGKMVTNGKTTGYLSVDGVPYHSVEELMVEAPDYGHETTSEAYSYYIWITAWNVWATNGNADDFEAAWENLIEYIIPGENDQTKSGNAAYNPQYPAEYADEYPSPDQYPSQLYENKPPASPIIPVGVDPLNDDLGKAYGIPNSNGGYTVTPWMTHWLLDVDNIYKFGKHESGSTSDRNVYINTYQRGSNESVWRTIPQPDWESLTYGQSNSWHNGPAGFTTLFGIPAPYDANSKTPQQWKYTGAPDADARTIQATWWANFFYKKAHNNEQLTTQVDYALKLGDFIRYAMFDKYFKTIPCHDRSGCQTTWNTCYNSTTYLLNWYASWGGSQDSAQYPFGFRIGASAAHQGYQNSFTAWLLGGLSGDSTWTLKSEGGPGHWKGSFYRTLEFWTWLQTNDGPIGGGATNSWLGSYKDPNNYGVTGYFYELAYTWEPVYHDPPSNNWFGMNVWGQGRNAETVWASSNSEATAVLERWVTWILGLKDQIIVNSTDFQVPSDFSWSGQPLTWDPTVGWTGSSNPSFKAVIADWSQDLGTASALAHVLVFYAASSSNQQKANEAQQLAADLLNIMYLYMGDKGLDIPEERQDYVGNQWGQGFNEPVYVPPEWQGSYPDGTQIANGATFISLRPWYKNVPGYDYVETCLQNNETPIFKYHRFWAQAEYAIACAAYSFFFENSDGQIPKYTI